MNKQTGFTLIELVTVIIILGILAAFAVPRFIDLSTQARAAATQGLGGSVQAASALAHSVAVANGTSTISGAKAVQMDGVGIDMTYGYPTASSTGIVAALQSTQGFADSSTTTTTTLYLKTLTNHAKCEVSYTQPPSASSAAAVAIDTSNCG